MNKINLNKKIVNFLKRTVLSDEVEVRIAKKLNNTFKNYEELEEKVLVQQQALNINEMKNTYDKILEELEEVEKDQNIQIIRLKQQLKNIERKAKCLENLLLTENNLISVADRNNAFKKSLRLHVLKISTGLHIDEHTPPNILRGFVMVKNPIFHIKSFELNLSELPEEECVEKISNLSKFTSDYIKEWENLFLNT